MTRMDALSFIFTSCDVFLFYFLFFTSRVTESNTKNLLFFLSFTWSQPYKKSIKRNTTTPHPLAIYNIQFKNYKYEMSKK